MRKPIDLSKKWYVKVGSDQGTFELLKKAIEVFKVPTYQIPRDITNIPQYCIRWDGMVINDAVREDGVKGAYEQLTLAEALLWLSYYVGRPKYVDLGVVTSLGYRAVRSLRVYKSGVQVRDLYGQNMGWITAEDITQVYGAIQQLRKR